MGTTYVMCSWCHEHAPASLGYCPHCGHDQGPRMDCRCPKCSRTDPVTRARDRLAARNDGGDDERE